MSSLQTLQNLNNSLPKLPYKMPVLFVGHGSPMNAIEENEFTKGWAQMAEGLPKPRAILCISAHWETRGTYVTAMEQPRTIHDFYGFPQALFDVQYGAKGDPHLAEELRLLIRKTELQLDHEWGLDHGTWSVIKHIYPSADVPVLQLSLAKNQAPAWHYELAKELSTLRTKGVLMIGSGNIIHNLRLLNWQKPEEAYDWALDLNEQVKEFISADQHQPLIDYQQLGKAAALAIPSPEHYLPLLYTLGLKEAQEQVTFMNDQLQLGAISMTSLKIG